MSRLRRALEARTIPVLPETYGEPGYGYWGQGMIWYGNNDGTAQGVRGVDQAMRLSAVFACLRLLSEAVATLPLDTFVRVGGTRKPYRPRPPWLDFQPPHQGSRIDFLSQVMMSLLTNGNAYILTPSTPMGEILDLVVLDPCYVKVYRSANGTVRYEALGVDIDPRTELLHIKGMQMPGALIGLSPIAYARETIGLGLAAQRFGIGFFENGALPSAVVEVPEDKNFSDAAATRFRETWNVSHAGVGNAQRIGVLTGGAKMTKVSVQPNDAQFLETRAFQVPDIARIFGVPPHLIADAQKSTSWGSGLAEQNLAFGQFSLRPWTERIEDGLSRLLTRAGLPDVFARLNLDALLRASLEQRYASYGVGITNRFLTINEARSLEDLPAVPWGNEPPPITTAPVKPEPSSPPPAPAAPPAPDGGPPNAQPA